MGELFDFVFQEIIYTTFNNPELGAPIAYSGWILLILPYGILALYDRGAKNIKERGKKRWNYPRALYFAGIIAICVHYYCITQKMIFAFPIITDTLAVTIGTLLMMYGIYLVTHGRISLDGYWSPNICEYGDDDKKLVTESIYKLMRHPIYCGQIFMTIATVFLLNNMIIFLFPAIVLPINIRKAYREDQFLGEQFPDSFPKYVNETPFFGGFFG
ncbi:MAG: hypothetical protein GY847_23675 [Proteobacteria bacterium]|nr:hypothetical protein [Pseudomonadota bacterium]